MTSSRGLWTARLFAIIAFGSLIANLVQAVAIMQLAPLKEVRPFLVSLADKNDVVATIEPLTAEADGFENLTQVLARQYVVMRHEIVSAPSEMERRWNAVNGFVYLASSLDVFRQFLDEATTIYKAIEGTGTTVEIAVQSVSTITKGSTYQVEFQMITKAASGQVLQSGTYVATMDIEFQSVDTAFKNRLVNPTGFTVVSYRTSSKAS